MTAVACALACAAVAAGPHALVAQERTVADGGPTTERAKEEAFARPVSVELDRVSLTAAVTALARSAGVRLQYRNELLDGVRAPVTLHVTKLPLGDALARVLTGTPLHAVSVSRDLVSIVPLVDAAGDSTGLVVGTVTDSATGKAIPNVAITVHGSRVGTVTKYDGSFVVAVPVGARMLTIRVLGYQPVQRAVRLDHGGRVMLHVALRAIPTVLNDVVTTATGDRKRLEVGNAVGTIDADAVVQTTLIRNMSDLLTARVPGVEVSSTTGAVGAPSRIRIRGTNSATLNNDPIIIVDGQRVNWQTTAAKSQTNLGSAFNAAGQAVPSRLDDIDPNTVESIDILRGPSAASLYGTDAANGVIVIKTKRGQPGPWRYTVTGEDGWSYVAGKQPLIWRGWGQSPTGSPSTPSCTLLGVTAGECVMDSVTAFNPSNDARMTTLGTGHAHVAGGSMSGGGQQVQQFFAARYADEVGIAKLSDIEKRRVAAAWSEPVPSWIDRPNTQRAINVTSQTTAQVSPALDVGATANVVYSNTLNGGAGLAANSAYGPWDTAAYAPAELMRTKATTTAKRGFGALSGNYHVTSWLAARANVGGDYTQVDNQGLERASDCTASLTIGGVCGSSHAGSLGNTYVSSLDLGTTLTYAWRSWLSMRTAIGEQYSRTRYYELATNATDLAFGSDDINGAGAVTTTESRDESATAGWYLEQSVSLRDRLFLTAGFRQDAGSAFGKGQRVPIYPKFSGSWVVSDESFFPFKSVVNSFRLRSAYGHSGVQASQLDVQRNFVRNTGFVDGVSVPGTQLRVVGNDELRPERSTEWEGGADLGLWDDRVTLELTHYTKRSEDAIITRNLPPSLGSTMLSRSENIGSVQNRGTELFVSAKPIDSRVVAWTVTMGASGNANKLLKLGRGVTPFGSTTTGRFVEGYPLFGLWQRPVLAYADANDNGILEANEIALGDSLVYVGSSAPKSSFVYSTQLALYNGLVQVNAVVNQSNKMTVTLYEFGNRGLVDSTASLAEQAAAIQAFGGLPTYFSGSGNMQVVSTLRFSELSASVRLPRAFTRRLRASTAMITLAGRNLGLWTRYRGADPNISSDAHSTSGDAVTDYGSALASPRNWTVRVHLGY